MPVKESVSAFAERKPTDQGVVVLAMPPSEPNRISQTQSMAVGQIQSGTPATRESTLDTRANQKSVAAS